MPAEWVASSRRGCCDEADRRDRCCRSRSARTPSPAWLRFCAEARICASLRHPNIVTLCSTFSDSAGLLVMEYMRGRLSENNRCRCRCKASRISPDVTTGLQAGTQRSGAAPRHQAAQPVFDEAPSHKKSATSEQRCLDSWARRRPRAWWNAGLSFTGTVDGQPPSFTPICTRSA